MAARLGRQAGADLIVIGRIHKPSFLFAYLRVRLVETRDEKPLGEIVVEAKGSAQKVTERAVARLAEQVDDLIARTR